MGACGCGDYSADYQFPGPDGTVYALALFAGCADCDLGPGVIIHRHGEQSRRDWDVDHLPQAPFIEVDRDYAELAVPMLSPEKARARFIPLMPGKRVEAKILVSDMLHEGLRSAAWDTFDEWKKSKESSGAQVRRR